MGGLRADAQSQAIHSPATSAGSGERRSGPGVRRRWVALAAYLAAGAALFVVGLVLRWWAIITLGRFFTVDVTIQKDHELVEHGPFRLVRHPSYTGVLLAFVGFALSLRNWGALAVILVPIFIAFVRRMNVEEEALSQALGSRYAEYMARTKRLVPGIY